MRHPDGSPITLADTPLTRALTGEHVNGMEAIVPTPDGGRRIVMLHARPLHDATGTIVGAVASSFNITALREHEAELAAFAGVVAHDLKSPLTAIGGYLELATDELADHPDPALDATGRSLHRAAAAAVRMRQLIDDLLDYTAARDAQLHPTDIDLRVLVDDVVTTRLEEHHANTLQRPADPRHPRRPLPHLHATPANSGKSSTT